MATSIMSAVQVEVEVLGLSLRGGALAYRRLSAPVDGDRAPDAVAAALGGVQTGRGVVCHSTSWRWDSSSGVPTVVLTYAVAPDLTAPEDDAPLALVSETGIVCNGVPEVPSPPGLHEHHVVAHAVRHLADLARRDPTVARAAQAHRDVWDAVLALAPRLGVAPHADLPPHRDGQPGPVATPVGAGRPTA